MASRSRSPPATVRGSGSRLDLMESASTFGCDSDMKSRVKTASYWLAMLTEMGAFSGKKYTREVHWAQDCVDRETRAGQGMNPEALMICKMGTPIMLQRFRGH